MKLSAGRFPYRGLYNGFGKRYTGLTSGQSCAARWKRFRRSHSISGEIVQGMIGLNVEGKPAVKIAVANCALDFNFWNFIVDIEDLKLAYKGFLNKN